jgi:hypothetical protein
MSGTLLQPTATAKPVPIWSARACVGNADLQSWTSNATAAGRPNRLLHSPLTLTPFFEQARRGRRRELVADARTAGRLSEDRHVVRIAAEGPYVPLHPAQRCLLILQSVVARARAERRVGQEPEDAQAVVHRHDNFVPGLCKQQRVIAVAIAFHETMAVDVHQHRQSSTSAERHRHRNRALRYLHGRVVVPPAATPGPGLYASLFQVRNPRLLASVRSRAMCFALVTRLHRQPE